MSWKTWYLKHLAPCGFAGSTFGEWWSILRQNGFSVDAKHWPKAAATTVNSLMNSLMRRWEDLRYGEKIEHVQVPPPLFVLGIWRSGTTHLHNLLSRDVRFAYPNTYQVLYPHSFLTTERSAAQVMQQFLPPTRPMDNVRQGVDEPQEDEFALATSGMSSMLTLAFSRTGEHYRRFQTLRTLEPHELDAWKRCLMHFVRKLAFKYGRPLVLKSPCHTARIRVLLEMFPGAKFVHIHRHPHQVFQSTLHTWMRAAPYWALQNPFASEDAVIRDYAEIFDAFFEQRRLIPADHFCEVAFDNVERDPIGQLQHIYRSLDLPDFNLARPALENYVRSLEGYRRNVFPALSPDLRRRLSREWSRCFDEWGYPQ